MAQDPTLLSACEPAAAARGLPDPFGLADEVGFGEALRTALRAAAAGPAIPRVTARLAADLARVPLTMTAHGSAGRWSRPRSVGLLGDARFVLVNGGHIAGDVSPPGPKAWHMVTPDGEPGTWWEDWTAWSETTSGPLGPPPPTGSDTYPVLGDGPGEYVRT